MQRFISILTLLFIFLFGATVSAEAQFQQVEIGVNGLTCSQCTRTVEMSIRKLDFVADVDMNLQHTDGKITIKKGSKADMEKIAQAVVNAGFSVRYLQASLVLNKPVAVNGPCFSYNGDQYVFTAPPKAPLQGVVKLKFIGKKYLSRSEFKKMKQYMDTQCGNPTGKVYHVSEVI